MSCSDHFHARTRLLQDTLRKAADTTFLTKSRATPQKADAGGKSLQRKFAVRSECYSVMIGVTPPSIAEPVSQQSAGSSALSMAPSVGYTSMLRKLFHWPNDAIENE